MYARSRYYSLSFSFECGVIFFFVYSFFRSLLFCYTRFFYVRARLLPIWFLFFLILLIGVLAIVRCCRSMSKRHERKDRMIAREFLSFFFHYSCAFLSFSITHIHSYASHELVSKECNRKSSNNKICSTRLGFTMCRCRL